MINPENMSDTQMKNFMAGMDNIKFSVMMNGEQQLYFMGKAIELLKEIYDNQEK